MKVTVKTSGYQMGELVAVNLGDGWTVGLLAKGHRAYKVTDKAGNRLTGWASGSKVLIRTVGVDFPAEVAAFEASGDVETATPTGDDVLASLATIASTEPMSLPVDPPNGHAVTVHGYSTTTPKQESRLAKTRADIQAREAARAQAYEASMPVVGDTVYRESDGCTGVVDDKTRHGRLVVVFRDGTERSVHWDVLVGEGFERVTADDFAMLNSDIVRVVARLHYFSRVLVKDAHLMLDVLPEHVDAARKAGLITSYDEWYSATSTAGELLTEADKVDAYLHFNPRPAVVRPVKLRQPIRACLARRKRKATKRARARVGGGW